METTKESSRLKDRIDEFRKDTEIVGAVFNVQLAEAALKRFLTNYPNKTENTKKDGWVERQTYGTLACEVKSLAGSNAYLTNLATSACAFIQPRNDLIHHLVSSTKEVIAIKTELKESLELPCQLDKGVNQILNDMDSINNTSVGNSS